MQAWHAKVQQACLASGAAMHSSLGGSLSFTAQQQLEGSPDMRHLRARNELLHRMAERLHGQLVLALHTDEELLHAAHTQGMQLADLVHAAGVQEVAGKGICDCCALVSSGQVCSV